MLCLAHKKILCHDNDDYVDGDSDNADDKNPVCHWHVQFQKLQFQDAQLICSMFYTHEYNIQN